jgi:hypothetical protein
MNCHCSLATHEGLTEQSIKLLLAFTSVVIPGFSLLRIHNQDFCYLLDMYMFRNEASSSTREG